MLLGLIWLDWPDDRIHIVFCDVGQGDAILILDGFTQILIDSGANSQVVRCLEKHMPFWDREIEMAVATHADNDHIGGFKDVFSDYFVANIILSEYGKKTDGFARFRESVLREKETGINLIDPYIIKSIQVSHNIELQNLTTRGEESDFGSIFAPFPETQLWDEIDAQEQELGESGRDINSLSIVNLITIGKIKILLTGDLDIEGEQALLEGGLIEDVDILKVGHHGSKTSTGYDFLQTTKPEISIISAGHNNSYGHPHSQVLAILEQFGSQIFRTDHQGEIEVATDGQTYWLEVER